MIIFEHRLNLQSQLSQASYGLEVDIRSQHDTLIVAHDPFQHNQLNLIDVVHHLKNKPVILNVKEEGLVEKLKDYFSSFDEENSFILDESIPFIIKYAKEGFSNFALRVSEIETAESAIKVNNFLVKYNSKIKWIWLDCFTLQAPQKETLIKLKDSGFNICLVSPELHILDRPDEWGEVTKMFQKNIKKSAFHIDAVCTKLPNIWEKFNNK